MTITVEHFSWLSDGYLSAKILFTAGLTVVHWRAQRFGKILIWVLVGEIAFFIAFTCLFFGYTHSSTLEGELLSRVTFEILTRQLLYQMYQLVMGWVISGIGFFVLNWFFLKRHRGLMLDVLDIQRLVIGMIIVGWPRIPIYIALVFILSVLGMIGLLIFRRKKLSDRLIITPYIIPAAIVTLILGQRVLEVTRLWMLSFV